MNKGVAKKNIILGTILLVIGSSIVHSIYREIKQLIIKPDKKDIGRKELQNSFFY